MKQLTILSTVFLSILMASNSTVAQGLKLNENTSNMTILAAWAGEKYSYSILV